MTKLNSFTATYNSDNRFCFIDSNDEDEIVIGASCIHVFKLPLLYSDYIKPGCLKVIYKQGLDIVIEKDVLESDIKEIPEKNVSIISVPLNVQETLKFRDTTLDTYAQLWMVTKANSVKYSEKHHVKVVEPLDKNIILTGGND